jgi:hypothetical protein
MTKPNAQAASAKPIVVLYAMSDGKGRAGVFKGPDSDPAVKAAGPLKFSVMPGDSDEARKLARELPPGRIQAKGQNIAPFVRRDLFEKLIAVAQKEQGSNAEVADKKESESGPTRGEIGHGKPRLPVDWADIKRGDMVVAQAKDPADGWWQAIVVDVTGDLIKLRWSNEPRGRPILKSRLALGLIFAGDQTKPLPSSGSKAAGGANSAYPNNWAEIAVGHVVLAKEDGPMQQLWEAKITSQQGELFTLEWHDHPKLPPIKRHRASGGTAASPPFSLIQLALQSAGDAAEALLDHARHVADIRDSVPALVEDAGVPGDLLAELVGGGVVRRGTGALIGPHGRELAVDLVAQRDLP